MILDEPTLIILAFSLLAAVFIYAVYRLLSSDSRHRQVGQLFDRPENEAFIRLAGEPAPLMDGTLSERVFDGPPHHYVENLQQRTAEELLVLVGAHYLPGALKSLLGKLDAFQATRVFLTALALDYRRLLKSQRQRDLLEELLLALVEADHVRKDSGLSEIPLYRVLGTHDMTRINACIDRLRVVAEMCQSFAKEAFVFPGYRAELHPRLRDLRDTWADLERRAVDQLFEIWERWQERQERYDSANTEIERFIEHIARTSPPGSRQLRAVVRHRRQVRSLRRRIKAGEIEPDDGIAKLERLLLILEALAKTLRRDRAPEAWAAYQRRRAVLTGEGIRQRLAVLGLADAGPLTADTLRRAYRRQAMRHHPDHGGDTDRFIEIHQAYGEIRRHLEEQKRPPPTRPQQPPEPRRSLLIRWGKAAWDWLAGWLEHLWARLTGQRV